MKLLFALALSLQLLSATASQATTCSNRFGFEVEFAYTGGRLDDDVDVFVDDTTADFERELHSVLSVVVGAVANYRKWEVNVTSLNYTRTVHGKELPGKLELAWEDPRGRIFRVTQESVSGRLFDGVELVFPPSEDPREVAAVLEVADHSPLLARAPDSGMHIWVDAGCLGGRELIQLILNFEDHHADRLAHRFHTPTDTDRSRFWRRYRDCNPNLMGTLRKMVTHDRVTLKATRAAFLQHRPEEHRCVGVARGGPAVGSRLSRRVWRYKGLNVASLLNLSDTRAMAVEFRAWDFLRPNQVPAAIWEVQQIVKDVVQQSKPLFVDSRGAPVPGLGRWKEISREEMLFQRKLAGRDPKDPKDPRGGVGQVNSCVEVNIFSLLRGQRGRSCRETPSGWKCIYRGDVCRPHPTKAPTAAPTAAPTMVNCEKNSFNIGARPHPMREMECRAVNHCQWSRDGGGQCHTIADCLDFNVLGHEERRRYCTSDSRCRFHRSVCKSK